MVEKESTRWYFSAGEGVIYNGAWDEVISLEGIEHHRAEERA